MTTTDHTEASRIHGERDGRYGLDRWTENPYCTTDPERRAAYDAAYDAARKEADHG
jgi:hypothetical protein